MLASLPHFAAYDYELQLHNYGDSHLPACSVSTDSCGFVFCDHLSDRPVARDVLNSLIAAVESSGLGRPNVSEL
jgi:hypothetical protein